MLGLSCVLLRLSLLALLLLLLLFETRFLCVSLTVLELVLWSRLATNSRLICLCFLRAEHAPPLDFFNVVHAYRAYFYQLSHLLSLGPILYGQKATLGRGGWAG